MRSTPAMQCGVVAGGRAAKTNLAGDVLRAALLCSTGGGTVNLRDTETYKTPPPRGTSAHRQSKGQLHTQAKTRCSPNLEGPFAAGAAPPWHTPIGMTIPAACACTPSASFGPGCGSRRPRPAARGAARPPGRRCRHKCAASPTPFASCQCAVPALRRGRERAHLDHGKCVWLFVRLALWQNKTQVAESKT
jgi:hypothetical protein